MVDIKGFFEKVSDISSSYGSGILSILNSITTDTRITALENALFKAQKTFNLRIQPDDPSYANRTLYCELTRKIVEQALPQCVMLNVSKGSILTLIEHAVTELNATQENTLRVDSVIRELITFINGRSVLMRHKGHSTAGPDIFVDLLSKIIFLNYMYTPRYSIAEASYYILFPISLKTDVKFLKDVNDTDSELGNWYLPNPLSQQWSQLSNIFKSKDPFLTVPEVPVSIQNIVSDIHKRARTFMDGGGGESTDDEHLHKKQKSNPIDKLDNSIKTVIESENVLNGAEGPRLSKYQEQNSKIAQALNYLPIRNNPRVARLERNITEMSSLMTLGKDILSGENIDFEKYSGLKQASIQWGHLASIYKIALGASQSTTYGSMLTLMLSWASTALYLLLLAEGIRISYKNMNHITAFMKDGFNMAKKIHTSLKDEGYWKSAKKLVSYIGKSMFMV